MRNLLITTALLITASAHAQQLRFNSFAHGGTGCPSGTVAFSPTPDGSGVSVLFDAFQAQVPQVSGNNDNERAHGRAARRRNDRGLEHKACNLSFNVDVPDEQMIEAIEVEVFNRGAAILDPGVRGSVQTVFMGHRGLGGRGQVAGHAQGRVVDRQEWGGRGQAVSEDWISNPKTAIPIRSNCARQQERGVRFDIRNVIEAEILGRDNGNKTGLVTMDSSDVNGTLKFRIITRPCGGRTAPGRVVRRVVHGRGGGGEGSH